MNTFSSQNDHIILLKQRRWWSAFQFDVYTGTDTQNQRDQTRQIGNQIGRIEWPNTRNEPIRCEIQGEKYHIHNELLKRKWISDRIFTLTDTHSTIKSTIVVQHAPEHKGLTLSITTPQQGTVTRANRYGRHIYTIDMSDGVKGAAYEPRWITIQRELIVQHPHLSPVELTFLGIVILSTISSGLNNRW